MLYFILHDVIARPRCSGVSGKMNDTVPHPSSMCQSTSSWSELACCPNKIRSSTLWVSSK